MACEHVSALDRALRVFAPGLVALSLAACATPKFQSAADSEQVGPKVYDILYEVQCEISESTAKYPSLFLINDDPRLPDNTPYVVNITLTLDVTNNRGINSSLAYVLPYSAVTNFTGGVTPQLSGTQHRNFSETANLIFSRTTPIDSGCPTRSLHSGLSGNLGIGEIIATGTPYSTGYKLAGGKYPYSIPALGVNTLTANDPLTNQAALVPSYGSTVDFTIVYGIGATPNWTLNNFVGPNPSGGALVNDMHTLKDTLVISVARVGATTPAAAATARAADRASDEICADAGVVNHLSVADASKPEACRNAEKRAAAAESEAYDAPKAAATRAAIDNSTRMILQRLLVP